MKGCCVSKPSISPLLWKILVPAHHCSLSPLLREQSEEVSLKKSPVTQTHSTVNADHKQQVKYYREGKLQFLNLLHKVQKSDLATKEVSSPAWLFPTAILNLSVLGRKWKVNFISGYLIKWEIHFSTHDPSSCFKFYDVFSLSPNNPELYVYHFRLKLQSSCETGHRSSSQSAKSCLG